MTDASSAGEHLAQSPSDSTASGTSKVNWKKIGEWEGNALNGYIPKKGNQIIGNSGVTVGIGVDLGQMNQQSLDGLDIPQNLKDKLQPYLGLKRADAERKLDGDPTKGIAPAPLTLSQDEVDQLKCGRAKEGGRRSPTAIRRRDRQGRHQVRRPSGERADRDHVGTPSVGLDMGADPASRRP